MKLIKSIGIIIVIPFVIGSCSLSDDITQEKLGVIENCIMGGQEAKSITIVALVPKLAPNAIFCSGIVISDKWVLTAAHCIEDYTIDEFHVRLQNMASSQVVEMYTHKTYPAFDTIKNDPDWLGDFHDIALIKLKEPLGGSVQFGNLQYHESISIAGFGFTGIESNATFGDLFEANVKIGRYTESEFIVGDENIDACSGDSGGPAFDQGGKLLGIASRGLKGATDRCGSGTIYTRIDRHIEWIQSQIGNNLIDQCN